MKALLPIVLALAGMLAAPPAVAGPWTRAPGEGYAKIWLNWLPGLAYHAGPEAPDPGLHPIVLSVKYISTSTTTTLRHRVDSFEGS